MAFAWYYSTILKQLSVSGQDCFTAVIHIIWNDISWLARIIKDFSLFLKSLHNFIRVKKII